MSTSRGFFMPYRRDADGKPLCRMCGQPVVEKRRSTFCSKVCVDEYLVRANVVQTVRRLLLERDKGVCHYCGLDTEALRKYWTRIIRRLHGHIMKPVRPWRFQRSREFWKVTNEERRAYGQAGEDARYRIRRECERREILLKPYRTWHHVPEVRHLWEAHHLQAVAEGGGGTGLANHVTACWTCHPKETGRLRKRLNARRRGVEQTELGVAEC